MTKQEKASPENSTNVRSKLTMRLVRAAVGLGSRIAPFETSGFLVDAFTRTRRTRQRSRDVGDELLLADRFALEHEGRILRGVTLRPEGQHPNEEGDGPHVLLVHGWDGGAHQMLPFVAPLVSAGFVVTLFDLPGHGTSEGERTHLRDLADAVRKVASHLGPLHAVIAHSVGAAAVSIAALEGLEVERLVYVAPPFSLEQQARGFARAIGAEEAAVAPMLATLRGLLRHPIDGEGLLDELATLRMPLLAIHDRSDRITSHDATATMVARWKDARLLSTEGLGHARILRAPEVVAAAVDFVRAAPPRAVATAA